LPIILCFDPCRIVLWVARPAIWVIVNFIWATVTTIASTSESNIILCGPCGTLLALDTAVIFLFHNVCVHVLLLVCIKCFCIDCLILYGDLTSLHESLFGLGWGSHHILACDLHYLWSIEYAHRIILILIALIRHLIWLIKEMELRVFGNSSPTVVLCLLVLIRNLVANLQSLLNMLLSWITSILMIGIPTFIIGKIILICRHGNHRGVDLTIISLAVASIIIISCLIHFLLSTKWQILFYFR